MELQGIVTAVHVAFLLFGLSSGSPLAPGIFELIADQFGEDPTKPLDPLPVPDNGNILSPEFLKELAEQLAGGVQSPQLAEFNPEWFSRHPSCTGEQYERFGQDYVLGLAYVQKVKELVKDDSFQWELYFPKDDGNLPGVDAYKDKFLDGYTAMIDEPQKITISCGNAKNPECIPIPEVGVPRGKGSYAVVTASEKKVALCDPYFTLEPDPPIDQPKKDVEFCKDAERTLDEFETRPWVLMHEYGHLEFRIQPKLEDFEWGSGWCHDLGEASAEDASMNADSWEYVALGTYWSWRCGRDIDPSPKNVEDRPFQYSPISPPP